MGGLTLKIALGSHGSQTCGAPFPETDRSLLSSMSIHGTRCENWGRRKMKQNLNIFYQMCTIKRGVSMTHLFEPLDGYEVSRAASRR